MFGGVVAVDVGRENTLKIRVVVLCGSSDGAGLSPTKSWRKLFNG